MFLNAWVCLILRNLKNTKANPAQAQYLKDREVDAELSAKYQIYNTMIKSGVYTTE
jgi:peptidyl-prolyl cis-trans isomerase D